MSTAPILPGKAPRQRDHSGMMNDVQGLRINGLAIFERRKANRFPVHQGLQYRVLNNRADNSAGAGLTHDMSSNGIRFSTENRIQVGSMVELSVNWPARLDGTCRLKVVAVGRVVRSEAHWAAASIQRHEFRTMGSGLVKAAALARGDVRATQ